MSKKIFNSLTADYLHDNFIKSIKVNGILEVISTIPESFRNYIGFTFQVINLFEKRKIIATVMVKSLGDRI